MDARALGSLLALGLAGGCAVTFPDYGQGSGTGGSGVSSGGTTSGTEATSSTTGGTGGAATTTTVTSVGTGGSTASSGGGGQGGFGGDGASTSTGEGGDGGAGGGTGGDGQGGGGGRSCDPEPPDNECGSASLCSVPTCVEPGFCDPGFLPASTVLTDPTNGDCQKLECTGSSEAPISIADDSDLPSDLPCGDRGCTGGAVTVVTLSEGAACIGESGVCDGSGTASGNCRNCRNTSAGVATDAGCSAGSPVCDELGGGGEGTCGECLSDAECPGQVCDTIARVCVDCVDDGDCPGEVCDVTSDVCVECVDDGDCGGQVCAPDNMCRNCLDTSAGGTDDGCAPPLATCDEASDTCEECQGDADCAGAPDGDDCVLATNECGCNQDNDCVGSSQGEDCMGSTCGCDTGTDCDHPGAAGPNCSVGVCAP